jgi:hypothetical protein
MKFDKLVNLILESIDPSNIAEDFYNEFLSKYKTGDKGTHNCAWATQQFINWANKKGIQAKAIYFVWPDKRDETGKEIGESHIAPVVGDKILDFTYKQFDQSFNGYVKIVNLNDWKNVYGKFGYGTNSVKVNGKDETVFIDNFDKLKNMKEIGGITTIVPSQLK